MIINTLNTWRKSFSHKKVVSQIINQFYLFKIYIIIFYELRLQKNYIIYFYIYLHIYKIF